MAIIKSLALKAAGTGQLFAYILRYVANPEKQIRHAEKAKLEKKPHQLVIRHNVAARSSVQGMTKEFERNEANRIHKSKNSIKIHHVIVSFSNLDTEHIDEAMLRDMARKFIELRGTDSKYVIVPHYDKEHIHLHCAMSGTKLNGMASRISRKEFANLKVALDEYQRQRYPKLTHSSPHHGKGKQEKIITTEKNKIAIARSLDKDKLIALLESTYTSAQSKEEFFSILQSHGHQPYYRSGELTGIKYAGDRKFRLGRLGYDRKMLEALDHKRSQQATEKPLQELRSIRERQNTERRHIKEEKKNSVTKEQKMLLDEFQSIRATANRERSSLERVHDFSNHITNEIEDESTANDPEE